MRIHVPAMLAAALLASGAAMADGRYDRKLDEAAAQIAAAKMGSLRGGFAPGEWPLLLSPKPRSQQETAARPAASRAAPAPGKWHDGLAIAVERRSAVSPEL